MKVETNQMTVYTVFISMLRTSSSLCILILFVMFFVPVKAFAVASLGLDPETISTTAGQEISVGVIVDAGTDQILGTDVKLQYDASILQIVNISDGTYLPIGKKLTNEPGMIYIAGIVESAGQTKTGKGTLATVKFKALKNGSVTLSFLCQENQTAGDSNIVNNDVSPKDIISCSDNGSSVVTVGTGGAIATPVPTSASSGSGSGGGSSSSSGSSSSGGTGGSDDDLPDELPRSGLATQLLFVGIPGLLLVLAGMLARRFLV
ncbi:MAG: Cohesin domain protein [Microgenomates bacterium OLB22]|nr:MAG: Cohesin domain protein [Microgenomates bacterium OLB22]